MRTTTVFILPGGKWARLLIDGRISKKRRVYFLGKPGSGEKVHIGDMKYSVAAWGTGLSYYVANRSLFPTGSPTGIDVEIPGEYAARPRGKVVRPKGGAKERIAERLREREVVVSLTQGRRVVRAVFAEVERIVFEERSVEIRGFGTFERRVYASRRWRIGKKWVRSPERFRVVLRAGKNLRKNI